MVQALVDRIYEAAFIPELWPGVLMDMALSQEGVSGALLVIDPRLPPLWSCTPNVAELLGAFAQTPDWYRNTRLKRMLERDHEGFLATTDFSTQEQMRADYIEPYLAEAHLDGQAGSTIIMPGGEVVLFTVERDAGTRPFSEADLAALDALRPHLARAALIASRLHLQQAQSTVTALAALGLAAAVVAENGTVIATNDLLETDAPFLRAAAFGRMRVDDRQVDAALQEALSQQGQGDMRIIRSIPLRPRDVTQRPSVIHVVPLQRNARDVFDSATALIVVTKFGQDNGVPDDNLLRGLFDLTASEAKLATALAAGRTLHEAAADRHIAVPTARTQLAQIFQKTGTRQQSELVALLKGTQALR